MVTVLSCIVGKASSLLFCETATGRIQSLQNMTETSPKHTCNHMSYSLNSLKGVI